jgi:Glycosyl transferase family 11
MRIFARASGPGSPDAPIDSMNSLTSATAPIREIETGRSNKHQDDGSGTSVVACLFGGLGNQMFQYAAGRALALKTGSRLILDATGFTLPKARRAYALDGYALAAETRFDGYRYPPRQSAVRFPARQRPQWIDRAARLLHARDIPLRRAAGKNSFSVFNERSFDFDPRFWQCGPRTYLVGYWQSERYFAPIADVVRRELTYLPTPDAANAQWLARIRAANAVCIHVRRGDYLLPAHFRHHGLCSAEYYRRAVRLMREQVAHLQFFVFSDDWPWCREHLTDGDMVIVDANKPEAGQDELRLMAACRHHIIANSSLSWWGAWLAASAGQTVVAPTPWFTHRSATPDLFPAGWATLPRA